MGVVPDNPCISLGAQVKLCKIALKPKLDQWQGSFILFGFQTLGPVNLRQNDKRAKIAVPLCARKTITNQRAYYILPTATQSSQLPAPLLTDCTHTWLRTLDVLLDHLRLPVERKPLFTLNLYGYNNVVPSFIARPTLLSGNRVSQYLSHLIIPGARCLKYPLRIPRIRPLPLPSNFPDEFVSN